MKQSYHTLGGSWIDYPCDPRIADRFWFTPGNRFVIFGLRLVRNK